MLCDVTQPTLNMNDRITRFFSLFILLLKKVDLEKKKYVQFEMKFGILLAFQNLQEVN